MADKDNLRKRKINTATTIVPSPMEIRLQLPVTKDEAFANWRLAHGNYTEGSAPPDAALDEKGFGQLETNMKKTTVYYDNCEPLGCVMKYMTDRYPCAMGRHILTNTKGMRAIFGISEPWYRTCQGYPPAAGVLTFAPLLLGGTRRSVYVYHMIAPDISHFEDGNPTPDLRALHEACGVEVAMDPSKLMFELARRHARIWYLAFQAARDHGFSKLSDVLVGGGAFIPEDWQESFRVKVHDTAMYLLGYHLPTFPFSDIELVEPPDRVPDTLHANPDKWLDVLHVNAWCHSSFVGNGNKQDDTLDGAWGITGPMAPLAWPYTNPWIQFRAVCIPDVQETRPKDRMCGKPPATLRSSH